MSRPAGTRNPSGDAAGQVSATPSMAVGGPREMTCQFFEAIGVGDGLQSGADARVPLMKDQEPYRSDGEK